MQTTPSATLSLNVTSPHLFSTPLLSTTTLSRDCLVNSRAGFGMHVFGVQSGNKGTSHPVLPTRGAQSGADSGLPNSLRGCLRSLHPAPFVKRFSIKRIMQT